MAGDVPYCSYAIHGAHPDNLAALGVLFGLRPAEVERCRVLDLGCASGGHLLPLASSLPHAHFVGVDLSEAEISRGRATADALGLTNLELHALDVCAVDASLGTFDYIVAHGLYSWVPPEVRAQVLRVCRERLAPQGVAYVSYNTWPGWQQRGVVRELLDLVVPPGGEEERIAGARAAVEPLRGLVSLGGESLFHRAMAEELDRIAEVEDAYLSQEYLAAFNQPLSYREFAGAAGEAGLQILGEAEGLLSPLVGDLHPQVAAARRAAGGDPVGLEQLLDLVLNRHHRTTLLCPVEASLDQDLRDGRIRRFLLSSDLGPEGDARPSAPVSVCFRSPHGASVTVASPPVKCVLTALSRGWPRRLSFEELLSAVTNLLGQPLDPASLSTLVEVCAGSGLVRLHVRPLSLPEVPSQRPLACPVARHLAAEGHPRVSSRTHHAPLVDAFDRALLAALDGTREAPAIVDALVTAAREGRIEVRSGGRVVRDEGGLRQHLHARLPRALEGLLKGGLLIA